MIKHLLAGEPLLLYFTSLDRLFFEHPYIQQLVVQLFNLDCCQNQVFLGIYLALTNSIRIWRVHTRMSQYPTSRYVSLYQMLRRIHTPQASDGKNNRAPFDLPPTTSTTEFLRDRCDIPKAVLSSNPFP